MNKGLTVVTGGAGFIGSHLVERLVAAGERVRVVEKPGVAASFLPPSIELIESDIRDREAMRQAMSGAATVYHLAGNPNLWVRDRRDFDAVNHQGTINVLDAAIEAGASRILHCSTESILTARYQDGPISEDAAPTLADAVGPYCRSKLRAELAARERAGAGHPVYIASPTMPVGPGDRRLTPPSRLIRDFCSGRIPARMDCTLNLVDVRDVAEGLVQTLERGKPGRRYLLGAENLTLLQILRRLAEFCPRPVPSVSIPYPMGLAFAALSELWADYVTGVHPRATVTGVRLARRVMHFDSSRTLAELGLSPRPITDSLRDSVAWMRAHGLLETERLPAGAPARRERAQSGAETGR